MTRYASLDRLLESIASVFDAYSVVLFSKNPTSGFDLCAAFSLGDAIDTHAHIKPGQGLAGWIAQNNEALFVENLDQKKTFLGYYGPKQDERIKVFMGCPLPQGAGVLCADSKKASAFTVKEQRILSLFARVASAIMADPSGGATCVHENSMYQILQDMCALRSTQKKWAPFRDQYLALAAGALGHEYALLVLNDGRETHWLDGLNKPLPPGNVTEGQTVNIDSGLLDFVFQNNRPVFRQSATNDPDPTPLFGAETKAPPFRSVLALPVILRKRRRGMVVFADQNSRPNTEDARCFARLATEFLAVFLENLHLRSRIRQEKDM